MKIVFINNLRLPTEKAYGQSIGSMAKALADTGVEVEVMGVKSPESLDFFDFYNLPSNFIFTPLNSFKFLPYRLGRLADYINRLLFLILLSKQKFLKSSVFITRQPEIAWFLSRMGYEVVFDAHRFPERFGRALIYLIRKVKFVSVNSYGTAEAFERANFYRLKVLPNGVDLSKFVDLPIKSDFSDTALYLGHLYNWKGIRVILDAAAEAPEIKFKIAGGPNKERDNLITEVKKRQLNNVEFIGVVKPSEVPEQLALADVLIYSASANSIEAKFYTSPIKLFEYLAAGRPIVAADLPSVREIVTEREVTFYTPGNQSSLVSAIREIKTNQEVAKTKARVGLELIKKYTWQERAKKLLVEINLNKLPFLALGSFLAEYPRNRLLLQSLAQVRRLEVKNYYGYWLGGVYLWWQLVLNRQTPVVIVQPVSNFALAIWLARPFRLAPVWADTFISLYDTLINDRALATLHSPKAFYYHFLDRLLIKSADQFIFDTPAHKKYFEEEFNSGKFLNGGVISVGVDLPLFNRTPPAKSLSGQFKVLFYGKYIPLQGVEIIVGAAQILAEQSDIHFTFIGSGQTYPTIKKQVDDLGLKNINFLPKLSYRNLIAFIKEADLVLGIFGSGVKTDRVVANKIIEGLAAGRPVLTADTTAVRAAFTPGVEVVVVPAGSSEALAEQILLLKNNPAKLSNLAEAGKIAAKRFDLEALVNSWSDLISPL